jgi:hypothetical protein
MASLLEPIGARSWKGSRRIVKQSDQSNRRRRRSPERRWPHPPPQIKILNQHNHMTATPSEPTHHEIAVSAYCIWEQEGRPEGRTLDHWLQAELQLVIASIWQKGATARNKEIPANRSYTSKMLSLLELPARSRSVESAQLSPTLS